MGMIINIASALKNRTEYNILKEPINDMLKNTQEAWEKKNPLDLFYVRGSLSGFQETYTSTLGFSHAFHETGDYNTAPIFNTEEGFSKTYSSRTFQGSFIITQQVLEDGQYGKIKDTATQFIKRWHGDIVEYGMAAISSGFGKVKMFNADGQVKTPLKLTTADTVTGDILDPNKNTLFSNFHTIVKREDMTGADVYNKRQSNLFSISDGDAHGIDFTSTDPAMVAKLADMVNQVITIMENYLDDNGKIAGVNGAKKIIIPNDAHLKTALEIVLGEKMLPYTNMGNPAYQRATLEYTPYLNALDCCMKNGKAIGFFIVDPAYNSANHGPEFTERVAMTMNVEEKKNPYGISYDARQRFDINVCSWRGIAYVYIGTQAPDFLSIPSINGSGVSAGPVTGFNATTEIEVIGTLVKPVTVVGPVEMAPGK